MCTLTHIHVAAVGISLSRYLVTVSPVLVLPILVSFRQTVLRIPLLLVRCMAALDAEIMSELAAGLEGAIGVAL